MKRRVVLLLSWAVLLNGCGGGGGGGSTSPTPPPPAITVSVSPTSAQVLVSQTQQFTATVQNTSNTAVTWQVNNITGGNATVGTISTAGLYTAPATVPAPATVTIRAVSQADPSRSGTASVTVVPPLSLTISPLTVELETDETQQFTVTVTGTSNTSVTWQVNGITGGDASVGTISNAGLYTAPQVVPDPATVTVRVVLQSDTSVTATAQVTILEPRFSDSTLSGRYVFTMTGNDGTAEFRAAGILQADGLGNVSGAKDVIRCVPQTGQPCASLEVEQNVLIVGTYGIERDGTGTVVLTSTAGTDTYAIVMVSAEQGSFIEHDADGKATGILEKQTAEVIANDLLTGTYILAFSGIQPGVGPLEAVGRITADGGGNLGGSGDVNQIGFFISDVTMGGTYLLGADGRGTGTILAGGTSFDVAFYLVSGNQIRLMSLDVDVLFVGRAETQTGSSFGNGSLAGDFAFSSAGVTTFSVIASAGRFTADGAGAISNGVLDQNQGGILATEVAFTGSYSVDANGRGTADLDGSGLTQGLAFHLVDTNRAFFIHRDSDRVVGGRILKQEEASFSPAVLSGEYAVALSGITADGLLDLVGRLQADGAGSATFSFRSTRMRSNEPNELSESSADATYVVAANGRGTISVPGLSDNLRIYLVSATEVFILQQDVDALTFGGATKQF